MTNSSNQRYVALDVMRGLTLALMLIVNTPGDWGNTYALLLHGPWHGYTPTDLVFPSFLFVVGSAMSLTMRKFAGVTDAVFLATVCKRAALIFACGYLLSWFPFVDSGWALTPIGATRIMGVLQRIGLCYLLAALILHYLPPRGALLAALAALFGYWALLHAFGDYTLAGNAARLLDRAILGDAHLYRGEGIAFDPEGILSTLPSVVNVLAGYAAGRFLQQRGHTPRSLLLMLAAGGLCMLLAHGWHAALPINKKLWTSSFALLSIGADLILLALLAGVIEVLHLRRWTGFFEVFGKNTLFIYVLAHVVVVLLARAQVGGMTLYRWIYSHLFQSWASPPAASLLFALAFMLACWCAAFWMDRRAIYIKL
jgi:predicted acyltransferase